MKSGIFLTVLIIYLCAVITIGCSCGDDDDNDDTGYEGTSRDDDTDDSDDDYFVDDNADDVDDADDGGDDTGDDTTDDDDFTGGYSLYFDGFSAYGDTGDFLTPALSNPFTIEGWVYLEDAPPATDQVVVQSYLESINTEQTIDLGYNDYPGSFSIGYFDAGGTYFEAHSTGGAIFNTWFHFAGIYSDNGAVATLCLYIDGVRQDCLTGGLLESFSAPLKIGKLEWADQCFLHGAINELRISSVVRYTADFTVPDEPFTPDADTLALYHFEEGSGSTAVDSSGNGNDLTLYGGYTWTLTTK
jgi:hypothetical protein